METPVRGDGRVRRKYTAEEKRQLLANLDLEVAHRTRQFEESLVQVLENFKIHHEGHVLRVPKLVRNITMGEFADKYNGDINACLRGLQKQLQGGEPSLDPGLKKRKWIEANDVTGPGSAESSRATKTARIASPMKMDVAKRLKARLNKTPNSVRAVRHPHTLKIQQTPSKTRPINRVFPSKPSTSQLPSRKDFNPALPKAPAYPRAPRKDETFMSVNGSPLVNPFSGDPSSSKQPPTGGNAHDEKPLKRPRSITIRQNGSTQSWQSRPPSQNSFIPRSQSPSRATHSSSESSSSAPSTSDIGLVTQPTALVRVPTKHGVVLEFDPLFAMPDELDTLGGITDSAKKQAREDVAKLMQAAFSRWKS